jgi:hypothetical protein
MSDIAKSERTFASRPDTTTAERRRVASVEVARSAGHCRCTRHEAFRSKPHEWEFLPQSRLDIFPVIGFFAHVRG